MVIEEMATRVPKPFRTELEMFAGATNALECIAAENAMEYLAVILKSNDTRSVCPGGVNPAKLGAGVAFWGFPIHVHGCSCCWLKRQLDGFHSR